MGCLPLWHCVSLHQPPSVTNWIKILLAFLNSCYRWLLPGIWGNFPGKQTNVPNFLAPESSYGSEAAKLLQRSQWDQSLSSLLCPVLHQGQWWKSPSQESSILVTNYACSWDILRIPRNQKQQSSTLQHVMSISDHFAQPHQIWHHQKASGKSFWKFLFLYRIGLQWFSTGFVLETLEAVVLCCYVWLKKKSTGDMYFKMYCGETLEHIQLKLGRINVF